MSSNEAPYYEIRRSGIQGSGAFAIRRIPKGTRLIEYTGERISHEEADNRPDYQDDTGATHVVLFTVDKRTVIDARVGGNEAQLFNHSCDGNCEAIIEDGRVYLDATREIQPGEELTYDYEMEYAGEDIAEARKLYPCRCGSPNCRGTLLDVPKKLLNQAHREDAAAAARATAGDKPRAAPQRKGGRTRTADVTRRTTAKGTTRTATARGGKRPAVKTARRKRPAGAARKKKAARR
jgi:hypothetical protein